MAVKMPRGVRVAVLYNLVGADEYEVLRQKVKAGEILQREDSDFKLDEVATLEEEIGAMIRALNDSGLDAYSVNIRDSFINLHIALTSPAPDIVFNLIEFFNDDGGQEANVAGLFEMLEVAYTGSPPRTLAICQRKEITKQILSANGIRTPRFKLVTREPIPRLAGLRYPVIVKPSWEDASVGVTQDSVVDDRESLERRVRMILEEHDQPALVEEYIAGRELGVSVWGNDPPEALPIEEMDFSNLPETYRGIISFESKWDPMHELFHKGELVCPAKLPKRVERRAKEIALQAYRALGCRDYARIDVRLDEKNRLYVLEVNPNPDLTEGVAFMASAEAAGYSFGEALRRIVEETWRRECAEDESDAEETEPPRQPETGILGLLSGDTPRETIGILGPPGLALPPSSGE